MGSFSLPPVQAGSLAKVVELADDPPAQLSRNGATTGVQEPLVLYIAKVPGSRDVFLTTMKPQEKVVTAQDIETSLYYVHVDSEKDEELLRSSFEDEIDGALPEEEEDEEDAVAAALQRSNLSIRRKPVLPSRPPDPSERPELPPRITPHFQQPSSGPRSSAQLGRKPVGSPASEPGHRSIEAAQSGGPRKLLGPRPMQHDRLLSVDSAALQDVRERQNTDTRRWSEQPGSGRPPVPPRPYEQKQRDLDDAYEANRTYSNDRPRSIDEHRVTRNGSSTETYDCLTRVRTGRESSLTLIRRYDHIQSNVGKIVNSSHPDESLKLDIMGLGYSKFLSHRNGSINGDLKSSSSSINGMSLEEQENAVFRCHLRPMGSPKPVQEFRTESHNLAPANSRPGGLRASLDLRRRSHLSSNGFEPVQPNPQPPSTKGYTFPSPWNGTCDFVTGVAGRSLKCRHTQPSSHGSYPEPAPVSELRFNLPSSKTFSAAPKLANPGVPREGKRSSIFSHRRQESWESTTGGGSNSELEDRLDLSLGQEHAGGGFGGKQAKLGKLIVEQEGLQMLDLVVAANMALWWRVYDKMA